MEFTNQKKVCLQKVDLSRKGSVDIKIVELVELINDQDGYFTTSCCSGRTLVLVNSALKKKGCSWLFVSHDVITDENVMEALDNHTGSAVFKFEPFVMHIRCSTVEKARKLHICSLESGFRNSGLTMSKNGGVVLAVRSTLSLEVPLSCDGKLLVSPEYISYIVNVSNEKMEENWDRTKRFLFHIRKAINQVDKLVLKVKQNNFQEHHTKSNKELKDNMNNCSDDLDMFCDSFATMLTCNNFDT